MKTNKKEVVGVIPAAGKATRIAPLPCSKEIYPVGFKTDSEGMIVGPKAVCHYLLEKMRLAGVSKVHIVLRKGKWDIPEYLGNGSIFDLHLAYLIQGLPYGEPFTLDQAYPFVKEAVVVFGYPDVLFEPSDAFVQLLSRLEKSDSDIILGVFPTDCPQKVDVIDMNDSGEVLQIVIKPKQTNLRYSWGIAVWNSKFTKFMHEYLDSVKEISAKSEISMGDVIQAAISDGWKVEGLQVSNEPLIDIGTGDDLFRAVKHLVLDSD